MVECSSCWLLR